MQRELSSSSPPICRLHVLASGTSGTAMTLAIILSTHLALALNPSKAFAPAKSIASKPQLSFAAPAAQQRRVVPPYMQV